MYWRRYCKGKKDEARVMKKIKDVRFWGSILGITGIGLLSGVFAIDARAYYSVLHLPNFAPPAWLFGPVWTILYVMIGLAFYMLMTDKRSDTKIGKRLIYLFLIQFILNIFWTAIFFLLRNNLLATIEITILWLLLITQLVLYYQYSKKIFWMMLPYFLWVSFATCLTYAILFLN